MPTSPSSGSITSPVPDRMKVDSASATDEQRLQPPQHPVRAPLLGQLHRGAREVAAVLLELGLEALEEGEGVGGGAGEAGQHLVVVHPAHLAGARLHDGLAHRDLAVARHRDPAAMADGDHGGGVDRGGAEDVIASSGSSQVARGCAASYTRIRCSGLTCV